MSRPTKPQENAIITTLKTQDTDVFADTDPGITFDTASETWTITGGVLVASTQNRGVLSDLDASALFNNGTVLSDAKFADGVFFEGSSGFVSNAGGAMIIAADDGVTMSGRQAGVDN